LSDTIGPDYRRVIDLIRGKITSGEWPVGRMIPSTPDLIDLTSASVTPVRRAVQQLQADGILEGHPGKGVFVKALPEDADRVRADLKAVVERMDELAEQVEGYADLRAEVGKLRADILYLYDRSGVPYDHGYGGAHDDAEQATRRRRPRR
jgi:DNA-binding GntR family transcriptional regulator